MRCSATTARAMVTTRVTAPAVLGAAVTVAVAVVGVVAAVVVAAVVAASLPCSLSLDGLPVPLRCTRAWVPWIRWGGET